FEGNADPGVRDGEDDGLRILQLGRNSHFATRRVLERIRYEIAQNLRNLALIGEHRRQIFRIFKHQVDGRSLQNRLQHAAQSAEKIFNLEFFRLDLDFARLDLRYVQQIIDHVLQALGGEANERDLFLLFRRQLPIKALHEHLRE